MWCFDLSLGMCGAFVNFSLGICVAFIDFSLGMCGVFVDFSSGIWGTVVQLTPHKQYVILLLLSSLFWQLLFF